MRLKSAKDLEVCTKGYELVMRAFKLSRSFPSEGGLPSPVRFIVHLDRSA